MAGASTSPLATTQRIEAGEARDLPPMTRLRAGHSHGAEGWGEPLACLASMTDGHSTRHHAWAAASFWRGSR